MIGSCGHLFCLRCQLLCFSFRGASWILLREKTEKSEVASFWEEKINNINKIDEKANDIVKGYISALNERSVASLERYLHFPHTRVMLDGESRCWETARKYLDDFQSRLEEDSWHSTELLSVDTEIISKKKCHTRISFKRLRRDGSIINTYHSLYVITEKNKSWGILFGSGTG